MVEVKGLSFKYSPSGPDILRDVSFAIEDGQCAAVLGNNGAGKTTLLKCIDRILQPGAGEVRVDGDNVLSLGRRELAKRVAYVAQNARAADMTVYDTVLLGRRPYIGWDATEHDREVVAEVMELMGVTPLALRSLAELSGGEAQRVKLATELSKRSTGNTVYVLDEPTTGLHIADVHRLINILDRFADAGNTVVVIEHNLDVIKIADYIIDLGPEGGDGGGEVVFTGTPEDCAKCAESYTGQFLKPLLEQ
mgnify:CR=1 FL=1